jgi:hypothetical protein
VKRHPEQISWRDGPRPFPSRAKNTKIGRMYRVGWGRSKSVRPPHNVSRESDNNIVPGKQANNDSGEHIAPAESVEILAKVVDQEEHHEEHHSR